MSKELGNLAMQLFGKSILTNRKTRTEGPKMEVCMAHERYSKGTSMVKPGGE